MSGRHIAGRRPRTGLLLSVSGAYLHGCCWAEPDVTLLLFLHEAQRTLTQPLHATHVDTTCMFRRQTRDHLPTHEPSALATSCQINSAGCRFGIRLDPQSPKVDSPFLPPSDARNVWHWGLARPPKIQHFVMHRGLSRLVFCAL